MSVLIKSSSFYNPFNLGYTDSLNILGPEIEAIKIFKDGIIIASSRWFCFSNNYYKAVYLPFEVKNKRKADLSKVHAFTIVERNEYTGTRETYLYIHCDLLPNWELLKDHNRRENETTVYFSDKASFTAHVIHIEPTGQNEITGRPIWGEVEHDNFTIEFDTNHRQEDNENGARLRAISEAAKNVHVDLSRYDLERLEKVLNISIK